MKRTTFTFIFLTCVYLGLALGGLYAYMVKPTQIIQQVNECQENYDLKKIETAGKLCNEQGGVLTSYSISDYSKEVSVSIGCDFNK